MSYCIAYNPEMKDKYPEAKTRKVLPAKKLFVLFAVVIVTYVFMQYRLYRFLIPGNPDITVSAFSSMVESVGDGEPVREALVVFCKEIIENGNP